MLTPKSLIDPQNLTGKLFIRYKSIPNRPNSSIPTPPSVTINPMIHENLSQSIENLSARMIAIRDSL